MIQKAYSVGNSVVLTVPKSAGIKAGTKVSVKQEKNRIIYEIQGKQASKKVDEIEKSIRETSGAFTSIVSKKKLAKILKELEDKQYDERSYFS